MKVPGLAYGVEVAGNDPYYVVLSLRGSKIESTHIRNFSPEGVATAISHIFKIAAVNPPPTLVIFNLANKLFSEYSPVDAEFREMTPKTEPSIKNSSESRILADLRREIDSMSEKFKLFEKRLNKLEDLPAKIDNLTDTITKLTIRRSE